MREGVKGEGNRGNKSIEENPFVSCTGAKIQLFSCLGGSGAWWETQLWQERVSKSLGGQTLKSLTVDGGRVVMHTCSRKYQHHMGTCKECKFLLHLRQPPDSGAPRAGPAASLFISPPADPGIGWGLRTTLRYSAFSSEWKPLFPCFCWL